jgi:hypothetical protein
VAADISTVARAFQIARSGTCRTVDELRKALKAEKHEAVDGHLNSGSLTKQLRALLRDSQPVT